MESNKYTHLRHKHMPVYYRKDDVNHQILCSSDGYVIMHIINNLNEELRKQFLGLEIVGEYFLYNFNLNYFYLVKAVYGLETEQYKYTEYALEKPIKKCHPSEYECILMETELGGGYVKKIPYWLWDEKEQLWKQQPKLQPNENQESLF